MGRGRYQKQTLYVEMKREKRTNKEGAQNFAPDGSKFKKCSLSIFNSNY